MAGRMCVVLCKPTHRVQLVKIMIVERSLRERVSHSKTRLFVDSDIMAALILVCESWTRNKMVGFAGARMPPYCRHGIGWAYYYYYS
jgi:hypothetical protein